MRGGVPRVRGGLCLNMSQTELLRERETVPKPPRAAYRMVPRASAVAIVASLVVLAALGWIYTVLKADSMSGMVMGLEEIGTKMPMTMATATFLTMWAVMMIAMMAPTVAPMALAYRASLPERGRAVAPTAVFVFGFLAVWAATGVVALAPYRLILEIPASAAESRWLPAVAGAVLVAVGALQFTRWKIQCLRTCRRPAVAAAHFDGNGGIWGALRAGLGHGWHCLGCCWALMVVLLVVGIMNLLWMAIIAAIFLVDKHWSRGEGLTRVVGAGLIVVGLAVIAFPDLLPYLSGADPSPPPKMDNM